MFLQNNKFKKIISVFLVVTFLVPSLFLAQPKETEAWDGDDWANIISQVKNGLSVGYEKISAALAIYDDNKERVLDGIAWAIAKQAVRQMTTSIVNWINSGFDGSPSFVTDFEGMMTSIADGIIGEYIYGSELAFLCSPFSLQLKMSLYNTFYGENDDDYNCTLSDAVNNAGGALQSLEDDFRWDTWIEMTNKQSNNVYGAFLEVEGEILDKILTEQQVKELQANWGGGFLSWEKCETVDVCTERGCTTKKGNCTIQTPGSVIESQLNKTLGAGQDSLITADEINEIIGALLTQLASSVMSSVGLLGQDTSSYEDSEDLSELTSEITDSIIDMLETELEYNEIKNSSLNLVQNAIDSINLLIDCLTTTGETDKLNLANEFLTGNTLIPQTNFYIDLSSLEASLLADIGTSDNLIIELNTLIDETNTATTVDELNTITNDFMALYVNIHDLQDISEATIELSGYGTIVDGLENGLTYNIGLLINTFAKTKMGIGDSGEIIYPPEKDKGVNQRYNECQNCKLNDSCAYSGTGFSSTTKDTENYDTP